ncbi:MAG: protein-L-isoaspartate(D-aspartate) O-methyltransferase [Solirubrobacteraceae bacterium]|nr:protein-L-isoaspartate(D-aspartate) O-methyltransferase [Solirubrobacteraceae bacterium]
MIGDARVLDAIRAVPRDRFVPEAVRHEAWENTSLPIGAGQTISQPLVVARMCAVLELHGEETVLDVGTGSGYHAAILCRLAKHVYSIERHAELAARARENLVGVPNVTLLAGDGTEGYAPAAPFDAINVAAAAAEVPRALTDQLAPGGRLIAPVGGESHQRLVLVRRTADGFDRSDLERVAFVPLVSDARGA